MTCRKQKFKFSSHSFFNNQDSDVRTGSRYNVEHYSLLGYNDQRVGKVLDSDSENKSALSLFRYTNESDLHVILVASETDYKCNFRARPSLNVVGQVRSRSHLSMMLQPRLPQMWRTTCRWTHTEYFGELVSVVEFNIDVRLSESATLVVSVVVVAVLE